MSFHLTRANQADLLETARIATRSEGWRGDAVAFGATPTGRPEDVVAIGVFENFAGTSACFSFAMTEGRRMTRSTVEAYLALAFHDRGLGLEKLWISTTDDNRDAQCATIKIGGRFEHRKRAGLAGGRDAIVFSLTRSDLVAPAARAEPDDSNDVG